MGTSAGWAAPAVLVRQGTFLTMKAGEETPFVGYMVIDSKGLITTVAAGEPPIGVTAPRVIDATGKIIIPGFVSAHSHIWQSAFRGLAPNEWVRGWVGYIYRQQAINGTAEDFYWFTLHGSLDHLRHGVTSAYNFAYGNRAGTFQEEQLRGELDSGMRFVHGWARPRDLAEAPQRALLAQFLKFAQPHRTSPLLLNFSISGGANSAEAVALDRALVRENNFVNQTHYLEYPVDKEKQREAFRYFVDAGALGPTLYFGHFIHTDDSMLDAVGKAGGGMSWNPLSNGRLASGIADIPKYLRYGVKIGMGVDGQASADLPDPFENMRMGLYFIRAKYEKAVLEPIDVLRFHTMGSASVMGVADKIASLEPGKYGDFLIINPASIDRAPVYDPYATLVFACNTQNLEGVYVGGELVSTYCKLTRQDFATVQAELHRRVLSIKAQANPIVPPP